MSESEGLTLIGKIVQKLLIYIKICRVDLTTGKNEKPNMEISIFFLRATPSNCTDTSTLLRARQFISAEKKLIACLFRGYFTIIRIYEHTMENDKNILCHIN